MRPALLIIIMDFLLSSLLLFVGGSGGDSIKNSGGYYTMTPPEREWPSVNWQPKEFSLAAAEEYYTSSVLNEALQNLQKEQMQRDTKKDLDNKIQQLQKEVEERQWNLELEKNKNKNLNDSLAAKDKDIEKFKSRQDEILAELEGKKTENKNLQDDLRDLDNLGERLSAELHQHTTRLEEKITKEAHLTRQDIQNLHNHVDEFRKKSNADEEKNKKFQANLEAILNTLPESAHLLEQLQTSVSKLEQLYSKRERQLAELQESAKSNSNNTEEIKQKIDNLSNILSQINEITDSQRNIDNKAAEEKAKTNPQFAGVYDTRVKINNSYKVEEWFGWKETAKKSSTWGVLVNAGSSGQYLLSTMKNIGLQRDEIKHLTSFTLFYAKGGENSISAEYDNLSTVQGQYNIAATSLKQNFSSALKLYSDVKKIVSDFSTITSDCFIYSHSSLLSFSKLDTSKYQIEFTDNSSQVTIKDKSFLSKDKIESGDFLITKDGYLVGVMLSDTECHLITSADFAIKDTITIPLSPLSSFKKAILKFLET
jgi:myosin heavy subunit